MTSKVEEAHTEEEDVVIANPTEVFDKYKNSWYDVSTEYWAKQDKDDNGMLGGFGNVSGIDAFATRDIIEKYQTQKKMGNAIVADCGCGIGRISHFVLCDFFKKIDLIDPVEDFLNQAENTLKEDKVEVRRYLAGIQDWIPPNSYDAYWIQWAIMYLTDADAIDFFKRCKTHLNRNGCIFVKDNLASADLKCKKEEAQFFVEDRGICRSYLHYLELFKAAGLKVLEVEKQTGWPEDLLPLYTFVLQ